MSSNNIPFDKNVFTDSNIINNNNKNSIKKSHNGTSSDQLIFFKEDVLKDIKQLESKIFIKYDIQHNINSNKINKIESILEQINQRVAFLSASINSDNTMKETIEKISEWNTKIEETLLLQDVRIKNVSTKLTESNDKFDQLLAETVIYPILIGPKAKFKTFHELIDFIIFNINTLLMFKEKISMDLKEYKYKTDSVISNFQIKLDYLSKNANAFTSSSIKTSEKKLEQIIHNQSEDLNDFKTQFINFKNEFNSFITIQEEKILSIIEKSKKFENLRNNDEILKKIEKLEKKIKEMNENKNNQNINKGSTLGANNANTIMNNLNNINNNDSVNLTTNNNINTRHSVINDKVITHRGDKNFNDYNVKNATSVLKEYIKGNIRENDIYKRRRSVSYLGNYNYGNMKEKIDAKPKKSESPSKKNKLKRMSNGNKNESSKISNKKSSSESEYSNDDNDSIIIIKEDNNNNDKDKNNDKDRNNDYQKYYYKVSEKDNNNNNNKKQNNRNDTDNNNNSVIKYITLSRQLNNARNSSAHNNNNSISNNSDIDNIKRNSIKDFKAMGYNINNINYVIMPLSDKNLDEDRNKIIFKNLDGSRNKDSNLSLLERIKRYEKINDVKTIITIIKKESRDRLIPILPLCDINDKNEKNDKTSNKIVNENNENNTIKTNDKLPNNKIINETIKNNVNKSCETNNMNILNNKNAIGYNSRNNIIKLESDLLNNNQNFSKTKVDFSKIKLQNNTASPNKLINQRSIINNNMFLPNPNQNIGAKRFNKATSAERLPIRNNKIYTNANRINISFKPYEESKEKDEQKMKRIFSQMKDFLPSDEKALIKERFIKYGYDKEKIFINDQKRKYENLRLPKA